jgi:enoyl-CoA hydratase/carnithine racemase
MLITANGKAFCTGMYVNEGAEKTKAKGKAPSPYAMVTSKILRLIRNK